MPGRGPQTFKKRQKEQLRKEKQQEKFEKRLQKKDDKPADDGLEGIKPGPQPLPDQDFDGLDRFQL